MENILDNKVFDIDDIKVAIDDEATYITGIANNKNIADAYGDVPKGDDVYDLKRYKKNPVVLVDHVNSVANIAGRMVKIKETDKGLEFKLRLMDNPQTDIAKHAVEAYKTGFGTALSIGGKWEYGQRNDKNGTQVLTKAFIHEISLVGVGADGHALTDQDRPKTLENSESESREVDTNTLKSLVKGLRRIEIEK